MGTPPPMDSPLEAAAHPDPYPYYACLVAGHPLYYDEGLRMWVASDAASVDAILGHPACRVRPRSEPVPPGIVGTPAGDVYGQLVRMTDGPVQRRRTLLIAGALARLDAWAVRTVVAGQARRVLAAGSGGAAVELMFAVPVRAVAALCGLNAREADRAADLITEFVTCIPASATRAQQSAAAPAAGELRRLVSAAAAREDGLIAPLLGTADRRDRDAMLANGIGLLSQTYEATAGLIGNTLVALGRREGGHPTGVRAMEAFVAEVARHDAPIQNTRRVVATPMRLGAHELAGGQPVLVVLAAANRDPAVNDEPGEFRPDRPAPKVFTFGSGAHRCPGRTLAVTIAAAVVGALLASGHDDPAGVVGPVRYLPLANARIPVL